MRLSTIIVMKLLSLLVFWPLAFASALNYNFVPFTSQKYCLTMHGAYNDNFGPFTLELCSKTNSYQQFTNGSTTTILTAFVSSNTRSCSYKCVDVVGDNYNQVRVTQEDCDPGRKTQFWVKTVPTLLGLPNYFWYKNFGTGRCMTAEPGVGTWYVDQYDCSIGALHQLWNLGTDQFLFGQPLTNQLGSTLNKGCLQVINASPESGAMIEAAACSATVFHQHFNIVTKSPTSWKLVGSGRCMDGGSAGGSPYQYDCYDTALNQQWLSFNYPKDGITSDYSYQMDVLSGFCLTWDPSNLANVHLEACVQGNTNQQWQTPWVYLPSP